MLRKQARQQAASFEAFLESLQLRIELRRPNGSELSRVCQLSERSNQMNSTQQRFSSCGALLEWQNQDERFVLAAWVKAARL